MGASEKMTDSLTQCQKGADCVDNVCTRLKSVHGGMQSSLANYMRSDVLRNLELFKNCNPEFVSRIIADVDIAFFKPGDMILQEVTKQTLVTFSTGVKSLS